MQTLISSRDFEKALEIGRPPKVAKSFCNFRALLLSGKAADCAMLTEGKAIAIAASVPNSFVCGGALTAVQEANSATVIEIGKSEDGANAYCALSHGTCPSLWTQSAMRWGSPSPWPPPCRWSRGEWRSTNAGTLSSMVTATSSSGPTQAAPKKSGARYGKEVAFSSSFITQMWWSHRYRHDLRRLGCTSFQVGNSINPSSGERSFAVFGEDGSPKSTTRRGNWTAG